MISNGNEVTGYVCDGKQLSVWLGEPDLTVGRAQLVSRRGEALGDVRFSEDGVSGEVVIAGRRHRFGAQGASGEAGLYRVADRTPGQPGFTETGWIVLADGSSGEGRTSSTPRPTTS